MKGAIICGLHDFERNTEKRLFHRGLKNTKHALFFKKNTDSPLCFYEKVRFRTILEPIEMACALFSDILLVSLTRAVCREE